MLRHYLQRTNDKPGSLRRYLISFIDEAGINIDGDVGEPGGQLRRC
jgi:hypothetical protein